MLSLAADGHPDPAKNAQASPGGLRFTASSGQNLPEGQGGLSLPAAFAQSKNDSFPQKRVISI